MGLDVKSQQMLRQDTKAQVAGGRAGVDEEEDIVEMGEVVVVEEEAYHESTTSTRATALSSTGAKEIEMTTRYASSTTK